MADETDWDMKITEECLRKLKLATTFDQAMEVATIMMNLRKTSTNQKEEFRSLVSDVAKRAIAKAESLKAPGGAEISDAALLRKPWAELTDEERSRRMTLQARAAARGGGKTAGGGALGVGLAKGADVDLSEEEKAAKRAEIARRHAAKHGVLGGGKVASNAGPGGLAKMSSKERRDLRAGGLLGGGGGASGGGGGQPLNIAHKRAGGAAPPVLSDYYARLIMQSDSYRQQVQLCRDRKGMFEDQHFPCEPRSVWTDPRRPKASCPPIVAWKRPKELTRPFKCRPQLFLDGADPGDVEQGSLGNCWFLGALSILATKVGHLRRLNVESDFEIGLHVFHFFRNRTWIKVVIDDRLPVTHGDQLVFGRCKNPGEFWVPLMEKAYAKLIGSYQAMEGGIESDALVDLTVSSKDIAE